MTDEITQDEKRKVLRDSYLNRAAADANLAGGRFKKQNATEVVGVPVYPPIPSRPWSGADPVPDEPPLGFDINQVESS